MGTGAVMELWNPGSLTLSRGPLAADPYNLEEIPGLSIAGANEVDICNPDNGAGLYYDSWEAVENLIDLCVQSKLYQDIQTGVIVVTKRIAPTQKQIWTP